MDDSFEREGLLSEDNGLALSRSPGNHLTLQDFVEGGGVYPMNDGDRMSIFGACALRL